ncbi:BspA family leucine-rich repeat surface protein [Campylobacter jejuni]|nr:BspA family leucine-rich repeat surface protein [Campylobacter jejuni]ELR6503296.1 BspA family leucine-rich repeat surface protein [Campylobacter jejuni]
MEDLLVLKKESFIVEEVKIIKKYKYTPKTKEELQALVKDESIYLGDIDTSEITDMSYLFTGSTRTNFSGIEKWNTGKVKTMRSMFECNKFFNEDIGAWDVGDVRDMAWMFLGCENFNQPLNGWDVRNVEYRYGMFYESGMERDDSKKPRFEKE